MTAEDLEHARQQGREVQRKLREVQHLARDTSAQLQVRTQNTAREAHRRANINM